MGGGRFLKVYGKTNLYGYTIGILVNESYFPRLPGSLGNATTFSFPVLYKVVRGATGERVVREPDEDTIRRYVAGARELESQGVRAITTSCGFTAMFQRELAECVDVPVFASSLLLVPLIVRMLKDKQRVGIVTADSRYITIRHFDEVGIDLERVRLAGMEGCAEFERVVFQDKHELDVGRMEKEVVGVATKLVAQHPEVRAILLECSLLPPFAKAVQETTNLPIFDFTSLVTMVHSSLVRKPFEGYL